MIRATIWRYVWPAVIVVLALPCILANDPLGTLVGFLLFAAIFAFPGRVLLTLLDRGCGRYSPAITFIFGIGVIATLSDVFARQGSDVIFGYLVAVLSVAGFVLLIRSRIRSTIPFESTASHGEAVLAGAIVTICIAPLLWRSGRFEGGAMVFYGPAGQDHLYHVALVQRLLHHVPPDNLIFSGFDPRVYHYFNDQAVALVVRAMDALRPHYATLLDIYFRCYPTILYFLLGALSYQVGRKMLGSVKGGVLGVLLLLGAGGLSWIFGLLQTFAHAAQPENMRMMLFSAWTAWDGVGSMMSLVHRPANYNGLLFCLAAFDVLLQAERKRRDWIVAGLLIGLLAGFNYTLAAILGIAALIGYLVSLVRRARGEASDLAWLAASIFIGAIPKNAAMLLADVKDTAPGPPFSGPNLIFPESTWGNLLGRFVPPMLLPIACLIVFVIVAYGIKLFGLPALVRGELAGRLHRGVGFFLAAAFALSFVIGTFFTYQGIGSLGDAVGVIFLQPTLWMVGLFSLRPILSWLDRRRGPWRPVALWGMLSVTSLQALVAFNFSYKTEFSNDTEAIFGDIRSAASADDVIAYLPTGRIGVPILGAPAAFSDYAIMALTGLDGYFASETYSTSSAAAGIEGRSAPEIKEKAEKLHRQRINDVEAYLKGHVDSRVLARLAHDKVRWIILSKGAPRDIAPLAKPWRQDPEIAVYRVPR